MAFETGTWTRKTEVAKDAKTNIQKVNHSEHNIYLVDNAAPLKKKQHNPNFGLYC